MFEQRLSRVREAMAGLDVDAVLLSVGSDLPWLIGYEAMALERLTMLVVPAGEPAVLVIPAFEVPRVVKRPELFDICGWNETDDPIEEVITSLPASRRLAIGDHTWSRFLVQLQDRLPNSDWLTAGSLIGPLRAVKDDEEIAALQRAATGVDNVALALQAGEIPLVGRTEADVSAELGQRILAEGHAQVNFAIVASGENAASPHHHPGSKVIQPGEVVLCDFGGTTEEPEGSPGYCSDITRCVYTGEVPKEFLESYSALQDAQALAVTGATVGTPAGSVDEIARSRLGEVGLDRWFLHRLGHGIGVEAHEDPYLVAGNPEPLVAGNAFSIEPGFYVSGRWGARIEDIVVASESGPIALNNANHDLVVVDV